MKRLWKSLVMGMLVAAAGGSARADGMYGNFTDTRLTPQTSPPAAVGNDMLLAESVSGPIGPNGKAGQWSVDLRMGDPSGNPSDGIAGDGNEIDKDGIWAGSGPTGTYAGGTIGNGKHTENTEADMLHYFQVGHGAVEYQYVFHASWTDSGGNTYNKDFPQGYFGYQL